ncbi:hypothetical protein [Spirosoma koreense]
MNEEQRKRVLVNVRTQLARLQQYLRDASERMEEKEKNKILDKMITRTKFLDGLEK